VTAAVGRKTQQKGQHGPQPLGCHQALEFNVETAIVILLLEAFRNGKAMTPKELLQIVRERYNPKLAKGWVHSFIGRHLDELQLARSFPHEDTCMTVPRAYLEQHIDGKFWELMFNLNEVGSSDWEDRKPKRVIVPRHILPDDVYHSVQRRYRHVTLLACVSAAGDTVTLMVISGAAIRDSIWRTRRRQNEDVLLRPQSRGYSDGDLFHEYLSGALIPHVANLHKNLAFGTETAILSMDSAPAHKSEHALRLLGENTTLAVVFPAHTTNSSQALDLVFFGALKKLKATAPREFDESSMNGQILRILRAYEQTETSTTIRRSFR
jgi:hypothetical protein